MSNQKYATEFKKQVVEFYLDHHTVKETLQEFHIPESTLFAWKHRYHRRLFDLPRDTKAMTLNRLQSHAKKAGANLGSPKACIVYAGVIDRG